MQTVKRVGTNIFVIAFLAIIWVDGFPSLGVFHNRAKQWIDPIIDGTGIWQGGWSVFALVIDNQNSHLEANIEYANGESVRWQSPRWKQLSIWQQMCRFREMEYTEQLVSPQNSYLLPELARYLAEKHRPAPGIRTKQVRITNHYFTIWPPVPTDHQPLSYPGHWFVKPLYEGEVP